VVSARPVVRERSKAAQACGNQNFVFDSDRRTVMKTDPCYISQDEKQRMIANAAYFRAVRGGLGHTDPVEDWLAAEAQIEKTLQTDCRREFPYFKKNRGQRAGLLDAVTGWMYRVTTRERSASRSRRTIG
jgi:hypothetical protein